MRLAPVRHGRLVGLEGGGGPAGAGAGACGRARRCEVLDGALVGAPRLAEAGLGRVGPGRAQLGVRNAFTEEEALRGVEKAGKQRERLGHLDERVAGQFGRVFVPALGDGAFDQAMRGDSLLSQGSGARRPAEQAVVGDGPAHLSTVRNNGEAPSR